MNMIELVKLNAEKIVAGIITIGTIFNLLRNFFEYPITNRINKIEEALSKNKFKEITEEVLKAEKEKLYISKIYKVNIERDKLNKIIELVNNSEGKLNLRISLKTEKYFRLEKGEIIAYDNSYEKIFSIIYGLLSIYLSIIIISIILIIVIYSNTISLSNILYLYGIEVLLGIMLTILLEKPYLWWYSKKVKKELEKKI